MQGDAGGGSGLRSGSPSTSWISAEGESLSSSSSECALQSGPARDARSRTVSTPASAHKHFDEQCPAKALSKKGAEAELKCPVEVDPELEEEDEALRAAAALNAMRAPGGQHC